MVNGRRLREELTDKLRRAIDIILNSQNGSAAAYERSEGSDLSVTVCPIMAMRAARNGRLSRFRSQKWISASSTSMQEGRPIGSSFESTNCKASRTILP